MKERRDPQPLLQFYSMCSFLFFFSFKYRRRFGRTISEVYEVSWNYSCNPFSTSTCNCENHVLVSVSGSNK